MSADKMFEELGYRKLGEFGNEISFIHNGCDGIKIITLKDSTHEIFMEFLDYSDFDISQLELTDELKKAINKKKEELGWLV